MDCQDYHCGMCCGIALQCRRVLQCGFAVGCEDSEDTGFCPLRIMGVCPGTSKSSQTLVNQGMRALFFRFGTILVLRFRVTIFKLIDGIS